MDRLIIETLGVEVNKSSTFGTVHKDYTLLLGVSAIEPLLNNHFLLVLLVRYLARVGYTWWLSHPSHHTHAPCSPHRSQTRPKAANRFTKDKVGDRHLLIMTESGLHELGGFGVVAIRYK
jgi:hypothetical protein